MTKIATEKFDFKALILATNELYGQSVDCDMRGKSITDFDVLCHGAYGPAVIRVVNLALSRSTGYSGKYTITSKEWLALTAEAFAQEIDIDLAGNQMTSYSILLAAEHGYGKHLLQLVEVALMRQKERA